MSFLAVLACTIALVFLLKKPLRKYPVVFYIGAVLLTILYIGNLYMSYPRVVRGAIFLLMQKCTLALALFVIVMFVAVFPKDSKISLIFKPIRAELSILASILSVGHMYVYLMAFVPRFFGGTYGSNVWFAVFAFAVAALLVLLPILGITSFSSVKRRMDATSWIKLQKWAYAFFGLVYLHLAVILLPSALAQGTTAAESIVIYTLLFGMYAVLRVRRGVSDSKAGGDKHV